MRREIFITLCSVLSAVFLTSYLFIFFLFRSVLFQEIRQQQINLQKYNETIFTSYIDSFSMVPFQLVNDEEIGELANTNNSSYLDMFRARELLRKKFNNYLNQQLFTSNLDCRILFYLNDTLPMDSYCDAYTLSEHVALRTCQVYSSRLVKDQEWYKRTGKITWSPYFFINKDTDELCYSKYVYNYAINSSSEGIGTVVIAIPENAFLEKISAGSITPNSRFFLSNEYQELLYASSEVSDSLFLSALSKSSGQILRDSTSHERYLVSTSSMNQDLFLTFLTPLSDIEQIVITAPDEGLKGAKIHLKMASVGATMNIIMASVTARGRTVIENAAKEPEIIDLATFLNNMGAKIRGAGTDTIRIDGVDRLEAKVPHTIIPDRIEAGTYISMAACIGNGIRIHNIIAEHLDAFLAKVEEMGVVIDTDEDSLFVYPAGDLRMVQVKTGTYPGFATDLQQPITPLLLTAKTGEGVIIDPIYKVITGDEKALTAAPGVGKKLAQRILLELKDKIAKETQEIGLPASAGGAALGSGSKAAEAAAALAVLGYTQQDISAALKGVDVETLPLEEIVRQSLKKMVK